MNRKHLLYAQIRLTDRNLWQAIPSMIDCCNEYYSANVSRFASIVITLIRLELTCDRIGAYLFRGPGEDFHSLMRSETGWLCFAEIVLIIYW